MSSHTAIRFFIIRYILCNLMLYYPLYLTDELWNRPCGVVMYLTYIAFAILVSIAEVDYKSHVEEFNAYNIVAIVLYWIWLFINLIEIPFIFLGRRQSLAFGGLYVNLFVSLLIALTVTAFGHSFRHEGVPVERLLLIIMAFTVYTMEQIAEPRYRELYWYYKGAISPDQIGKVSPISGIGSNALMKLAHNASKAMGISDEALQVIEAQLSGMKIRQGEEEALDDWLAVIYKLRRLSLFALHLKCSDPNRPFHLPNTAILSVN